MKKIILIILFSVFLTCECLAQVTTSGLARKFRGAATLPATCQANDVYVDTDASTGSRIYLCESANTWVAQGGTLGNCTGGPCFDGTSDGGTSLTFYDVGGNGIFSYSSAGFAVDKALSATSYSSTGSGQSSINQGLIVNESGGATAYDAFRVETDTLNAILTTPTGDIVTILGNWDASGALFRIPAATSCVATDCDAAGEAGRICADTNATSGQQFYLCEGAAGWKLQGAGGSESTTVADTNSINMTLTGTEVKGDVIGSGINWTDVKNEPSSAINWTDIPLQVSNINWGAIEEIQSGDLNWTSIEVLAPIADTMIGDMDSSGACAAGTVCGGGHTHGSTEITEADPTVDTPAEIIAILDTTATLTDENICNYEATGTLINCDIAIDATTACAAGSICGGGHTHPQKDGIIIESPVIGDMFYIPPLPDAITINKIKCIVDPGGAAESAVVQLWECDGTATNCVSIEGAITCDNDGAVDDASIDNAAIDANDWLDVKIGTVTGTITAVSVGWDY